MFYPTIGQLLLQIRVTTIEIVTKKKNILTFKLIMDEFTSALVTFNWLIKTNHTQLINLAHELGLGVSLLN